MERRAFAPRRLAFAGSTNQLLQLTLTVRGLANERLLLSPPCCGSDWVEYYAVDRRTSIAAR